MRVRHESRRIASLAAAALLLLPAMPATAQIPDEFTNLRLLPQEIEKAQLVGIMRGWATGLGVRCNHCHVGPDDLQGMDFASDEKEKKRAARVMLEMTRAINGEHLRSLEQKEPPQVVSCYTCHRGQPEPPRNLVWLLSETALNQGVEAAMSQYSELKQEHYGAGVYDFRVGTLAGLAQAAFEAGKLDAAIQVLASSLELYPDSADLHAFHGMAMLQSGDAEAAQASFSRALAIDPDNAAAQRGRAMLAGQGPGDPE